MRPVSALRAEQSRVEHPYESSDITRFPEHHDEPAENTQHVARVARQVAAAPFRRVAGVELVDPDGDVGGIVGCLEAQGVGEASGGRDGARIGGEGAGECWSGGGQSVS